MTKLYLTLIATAIFVTGMIIGEIIRWMGGKDD